MEVELGGACGRSWVCVLWVGLDPISTNHEIFYTIGQKLGFNVSVPKTDRLRTYGTPLSNMARR